MSMSNQGINYDTQAMLTLRAVDGGRFIAGTCVAVRTAGQKGQLGNVYGYVPAVGVCPEGSENRYQARAVKVQGGYLILDDGSGHIVVNKSRDKAREIAHKRLQDMGSQKLATFTPVQLATLKEIADLRSLVARRKAAIAIMESDGDEVPKSMSDRVTGYENEIETLRATLK